MKNFIDFERVSELSKKDKSNPFVNKVVKLSEETGEVAQVSLKYINSSNVSKSVTDEDPKELVLEELCDVINTALDLINSLGVSDEEVKVMFDKKLDKWESKLK